MRLVLLLLLEYIALNNIQARWLPYTLLVTPVLSRWAMVNSIYAYPYARPVGLGTDFKQAVSWQQFWVATVVATALAVGLFHLAGLVIIAFTWLIVTLTALYFRSKLKGLTGDTYGAINEIAFIAALVVINVLSYKGWLL